MTPGLALREWRKSHRWRLRDVADLLMQELPGRRFSAGTISSLEAGLRTSAEIRAALAAIGAPTDGLGVAARAPRAPRPSRLPKRPRPERIRQRTNRAHTIPMREIRRGVREVAEPNVRRLPLIAERECDELPRPCPWISCRYHLFLDVASNGAIKLNFPDLLLEDGAILFEAMPDTCALDVAARGPRNLEAIGAALNITRERVRQLIEIIAPDLQRNLAHLRPARGVCRPDLHEGE